MSNGSGDRSFKGLITKGVGGTYTVLTNEGESILCQIRGGIRNKKITPSVGDKVEFSISGDPDIPYVLEKIGKRHNDLVRPPLANVSSLILVFALKDPEPDLKLLDKMLIICAIKDIRPVIVFTKNDLIGGEDGCGSLHDVYSRAGFKCFVSSMGSHPDKGDLFAATGAGKGEIIAFAGPSGVGKSTLCNYILGTDKMIVGDISERLGRGKHTTRHVELFDMDGYFLTDTPGFTSLDLFELGITHDQVVMGYPEISTFSSGCRFSDCRHIAEKDCAIRDNPLIDEGRYMRYKEFYEILYSRRFDFSQRR